jgi:DNA-directed RNA polymerase subunit F
MVDFVHVNRTLLVSASLTVNSSVTASSNNASISIMQGGEETIPMSISSASNVMETAMISWSSPTPDFDSMFNVNAPMFEYLGPGDDVSRSLILQAKNETLPGNYSITVEVASAYINPLEVSSFSVSIEVLPQLKDNLIFNISSFDPYFRSNECRLVSLDLTKMYGPGDLWLDLSGAVDGRFVHGDEDWTFDFRSLAADNTEFRGPWSHEHRQRGEMITLELCSPSVMPSQHPVIFDIVPTWNGFDVSLNSQTITVYPYHESEWEIDGKSTQLMERTVNITGSLLNNSHSGRVIFEFALNSSVLDSSDLTKQTMSELDMYRAITLNEPGDFHVNLNLSLQLDEGVQGYTTVYVRVTDAKSANQLELVYQYNPMVDSDGDQIADSLDAFVNVASQWSDIDGDGYGDNWGNASWNQTRQQYEIGQFVFGAVMADYCPEIPGNSTANGFYGCPDDDGDGIPNLFDYEDEVLDADGDGIPDEIDECPYTPFGTLIDSLGCKLQTDADGTMSRNEDSFLQGEIARTVGWGAILLAVFTFLQTNAAAAILPDTFRWVQVFRNNSKLTREEENELTYLQSLVQAYYLEPETLAEELREFKADLTARYTNNEVKKSTQEKISVLIKDILSSSEDDLAHIAHNEGYFGLVSTVALNERMDLLSEKLAMENDTPHNVFDELLPPQDVKGEINPENGFEWIEYPEGSKSWYLRSQSADPWKKWES